MKERAETSGRGVAASADLRLRVAHRKPNSLTAYANRTMIGKAFFPKKYRLTVIDLLKKPRFRTKRGYHCRFDHEVDPGIPKSRKIIGMLSDTKKVPEELNLTGNEGNFCNTGRIATGIAQ